MIAAALARARNLISEAGIVSGGLCVLATIASRHPRGFPVAEKLLRLAIFLRPDCAEPYANLGARLLGKGRAAEAVALLQQAQTIQPSRKDTSHILAMAQVTNGQFHEAANQFKDLIKSDPDNVAHYIGLGLARYMPGEVRDGVRAWSEGMAAQARLAHTAGLPASQRYLAWHFTHSLGHAALLDVFAKRKLMGLSSVNYTVLAPPHGEANAAYLDAWRNHFEIVRGPNADRIYRERGRLAEEYPTVFFLDGEWRWFHDVACAVEQRWEASGGKPLLSLGDEEKDRSRKALERLGLPRDAWFVALHVREAGFHNAEDPCQGSSRNAEIRDYLPAVRCITAAGGWVVRLGDSSSTKLPELPMLIDYAHARRQDWLDVFLLSQARFLLGTNSGPAWVAGTFGVPTLLTNWSPIGIQSHYSNTITLPQILWSKSQKRHLTFREQMTGILAHTEYAGLLERGGIRAAPNSPREIAAATEEMLLRAHGAWVAPDGDDSRQHAFASLLRSADISGRSRIASQFLRENAELLA